jgi:hypothetical protein
VARASSLFFRQAPAPRPAGRGRTVLIRGLQSPRRRPNRRGCGQFPSSLHPFVHRPSPGGSTHRPPRGESVFTHDCHAIIAVGASGGDRFEPIGDKARKALPRAGAAKQKVALIEPVDGAVSGDRRPGERGKGGKGVIASRRRCLNWEAGGRIGELSNAVGEVDGYGIQIVRPAPHGGSARR